MRLLSWWRRLREDAAEVAVAKRKNVAAAEEHERVSERVRGERERTARANDELSAALERLAREIRRGH